MIVGLLAEKGGTGKTTLATNLAGMSASAGRCSWTPTDREALASGRRHAPQPRNRGRGGGPDSPGGLCGPESGGHQGVRQGGVPARSRLLPFLSDGLPVMAMTG